MDMNEKERELYEDIASYIESKTPELTKRNSGDWFTGYNEAGEETEFYKQLEYDYGDKHIVMYTDNIKDENGAINFYVSYLTYIEKEGAEPGEKWFRLETATDEEYDRAENIYKTLYGDFTGDDEDEPDAEGNTAADTEDYTYRGLFDDDDDLPF